MYILQNCCEISDKPLFKGQVLLQDSTLGWVDICIFSRALPMKKHLRPYIDERVPPGAKISSLYLRPNSGFKIPSCLNFSNKSEL